MLTKLKGLQLAWSRVASDNMLCPFSFAEFPNFSKQKIKVSHEWLDTPLREQYSKKQNQFP